MKTSIAVLMSLTFALAGCASVREEQTAAEGVVFPPSMCAKRGKTAAVDYQPGKKMNCELEEVVGSHVPSCVCRDAVQMAADRDVAQQLVRESEVRGAPVRGN